jgi:Flp pilus assembly protein TadB
MTDTATVPDMLTALAVLACAAAILAIDVLLGETIVALLFGIAVIIGIPAWVIGTTWIDQRRRSRQNQNSP